MLTLTFTSCKKTSEDFNSISNDKINANGSLKVDGNLILSGKSETVPMIFTDKFGKEKIINGSQSSSLIGNPISNFDYVDCGDDIISNSSTVFKGITVQNSCTGYGFTHYVTALWTIIVPADVVISTNSQTKGRWRFSTTDPYQLVNLAISQNGSAFTNPNTGSLVKQYFISFPFDLDDFNYCFNNSVFLNFTKIVTDCSELTSFGSGTSSEVFDPATYVVKRFAGVNFNAGGGVHTMRVNNVDVLCNQCHSPTLGDSPEHKFEYQLNGTSTWTTVVRTNIYSFDIVLTDAGTYNYRCKSKLKPDGTYSDYFFTGSCVIN